MSERCKDEVTVIFDKGMNAEENIAAVDALEKDDDLVAMLPIRHFTGKKIRCHILSCIVALCYLRLIERKLRRTGLDISATTAMERMHKLHSCLCWSASKRKPLRILEEPTKDQALILKAFGHEVTEGVLQKITA